MRATLTGAIGGQHRNSNNMSKGSTDAAQISTADRGCRVPIRWRLAEEMADKEICYALVIQVFTRIHELSKH